MMNRLLRNFVCLGALWTLLGCGSTVTEQKPPETVKELTPEEKQNYEDQMKMMKEKMESQKKK